MIKVVTHNFHDSFTKFFTKLKNVKVDIVNVDELVIKSVDYQYAVVCNLDLETYKNIKCKKILVDVFPSRHSSDILHWGFFDLNTTAIVFSTYEQLLGFNFKNCKKVHVINWAIDLDEYPLWEGGTKKVLGVCNFIKRNICGENIWNDATSCLPKTQIGFFNEHLVENIGFKSSSELNDFYKTYNVFFHHTTTSPAPNVLLEAMAVGIPIVSYESWFAKEHLANRGFISSNIDELKKELTKLIEDPSEYKIYNQQNRDYIRLNFSPELFYHRWNQLLN